MKKTLIATALALASMSSFAGNYFVVVPLPGKASTIAGINVALAGSALPSAIVGTPYAGFDLKPLLSVTGDPAYSGYGVKWSLASGSLPAGLTLNANGTISGTPTAAGTGSFQVKATYKTKSGAQAYQIVVGEIVVALASATPPEAVVGQAYSFDLKSLVSVTGDSAYQAGAGVTWSVVSSTLPAGLQLKTDGTISGTPTAGGNGAITARATYRNSKGEQTYQIVSLNIEVRLGQATLPKGTMGQPYAAFDFKNQLQISGDPAYTAGSAQFTTTGLPPGLSLSATGVLTGTPTVKTPPGAYTSITVVASYKNVKGEQSYQLMVGGQPVPVSQIATGAWHSCAVTSAGGVLCWGLNSSGQLGNGSTSDSRSPVQVSGLASGVASVSVGMFHSCAVTKDGVALCWGSNSYGQLGDGYTSVQRTTPYTVTGLSSGVASISTRHQHNCALTTSGAVRCWGANESGQLGEGTTTQRNSPAPVSGLSSGVSAIGVGDTHSCALTTAGIIKCWGANNAGQLGDGTWTQRLTPVAVAGIGSGTDLAVQSLSVGGYHSCAGISAWGMNGFSCWGGNGMGQLGDGSRNNSATPRNSVGIGSRIAAGGYHTCVITDWNGVECWGNGSSGQLGYGDKNTLAGGPTYQDVPGIGMPSSVVAGYGTTCAVTDTGTFCWGGNGGGQLGDGSTTDNPSPVAVTY